MRFWLALLLALFAALAGALLAYTWLRTPVARGLDTPAVVEKIWEAARLETLDVRLYKKIDFAPALPIVDSVWGNLANWIKLSIHKPRGRAIVSW